MPSYTCDHCQRSAQPPRAVALLGAILSAGQAMTTREPLTQRVLVREAFDRLGLVSLSCPSCGGALRALDVRPAPVPALGLLPYCR